MTLHYSLVSGVGCDSAISIVTLGSLDPAGPDEGTVASYGGNQTATGGRMLKLVIGVGEVVSHCYIRLLGGKVETTSVVAIDASGMNCNQSYNFASSSLFGSLVAILAPYVGHPVNEATSMVMSLGRSRQGASKKVSIW